MFKLSDLSAYNKIVIQCHDNPDADSVSSAFAIQAYLATQGKKSEIIYSGFNVMKKPNLLFMTEWLNIPVRHTKVLPPPDLLICVDCQYGQGNVTKFKADAVAVIDHHLQVIKKSDFDLGIIEPDLGSCATLIWNLLNKEDFDFSSHKNVATALYYGLFTDTNSLMEINHPIDKDMRDYLPKYCDMSIIRRLRNSNLTLEELEIAGVAMLRNTKDIDRRFAIFKAEECDPNILGFISDMALQVDSLDLCVVFNQRESSARISVRSCSREIMASEYAEYLTDGVGSGGGHRDKAGGSIHKAAVEEMGMTIHEYIIKKTTEYFNNFDIIAADNHNIDVSGMTKYVKKPIPRAFARSVDVFEENTPIMIRTLEGDSFIKSSPEIYLMVGVEGEVYPIKAEKFHRFYHICEEKYETDYKYDPTVKNETTGEVKKLTPFLKFCMACSERPIYAEKLTRNTKVFTEWNPNGYMHGEAGDYIAFDCENINDVYIIQDYIFDKTYEKMV